ncbi:UNVERIFIED_CONTAM: hypothetical protein NCL1_12936 [Trichonephila clavipes]
MDPTLQLKGGKRYNKDLFSDVILVANNLHGLYTAGHTKCNTKKDQKYHSEIYLADNMLYKDQMMKITASCDVWMTTKSVVSVASIVVYNRCHTPRHRIKEALDVWVGYSSPCCCIPGQSL